MGVPWPVCVTKVFCSALNIDILPGFQLANLINERWSSVRSLIWLKFSKNRYSPVMSMPFQEDSVQPWRSVRLDTLVRLRWVAVIGQTTAVLVVYAGLEFPLPIWACLSVITLAAWLNIALRVRFRMTQQMESERAAWLLAFDVAELAILLFLTGGMQNPFSFLLISPVLLSATALPPRMTVLLGVFAAACATVLIFYHFPLPWDPDDPLVLPAFYTMGMWLALLLALGFI